MAIALYSPTMTLFEIISFPPLDGEGHAAGPAVRGPDLPLGPRRRGPQRPRTLRDTGAGSGGAERVLDRDPGADRGAVR